jgi:hypothetical protein
MVQGGVTKYSLLSDLYAAPSGSSRIGWLRNAIGAVATTIAKWLGRQPPSVFEFMTDAEIADVQAGTVTLDVTNAIEAFFASIGGVVGGKGIMPRGRYKTTRMLTAPYGIILLGEGSHGGTSAQRQAATSIYGFHNGSAILSLAGTNGCTLQDIGLQGGDATTHPKTALMLGRRSSASSGYHKIDRVSAYGYFSVAPFYSIASEDNLWIDVYAWIYGGTAKYCFYTGEADLLAVDSLVTSSNLENTLIRPWFLNTSSDANSAGIYIECTQATGSWTFIGGYMTMQAGAYIQLNASPSAGTDQLGPFTFIATSGELYLGGDPLYGYRLTATAACDLVGLNIVGGRFAFQAGTNHYQIYKDPVLTLRSPTITLQPPEAFPYAQTSVSRDHVLGGTLNIGRYYEWTPVTFAASWSDTLGAPYAPASYCIDSDGFVHFRGQVVSTGLGPALIFYLPGGLIPPVNMFFGTSVGTTVGQILITSATGAVTLPVGSTTSAVDLSPIRFKMN